MAWIAPTIAAVGSVASAGINAASASSKNQSGENLQYLLEYQAMQNAKNQQAYTNAQTALANTLARAGYSDSYGSTVSYNPSTNTWETKLGKLPEQESTAAAHAAISRNTTDLRTAEYANEQAMKRASANDPLLSSARIAMESYQPRSVDELAGLLQGAAIDATNRTNQPIISDTLRSFARTGTAAGPVLSNLMSTNASTLRDTIIDARIKALENNTDINTAQQKALRDTYTSLMSQSNPTLQFSNLSTTDPNQTLSSLASTAQANQQNTVSNSARTSSNAATPVTTASKDASSSVPDSNASSETMQSIGKSVTDLTQSGSGLQQLIKYLTGSGSSSSYDPSSYGYSSDTSSTGAQALKSMGFFNPVSTTSTSGTN